MASIMCGKYKPSGPNMRPLLITTAMKNFTSVLLYTVKWCLLSLFYSFSYLFIHLIQLTETPEERATLWKPQRQEKNRHLLDQTQSYPAWVIFQAECTGTAGRREKEYWTTATSGFEEQTQNKSCDPSIPARKNTHTQKHSITVANSRFSAHHLQFCGVHFGSVHARQLDRSDFDPEISLIHRAKLKRKPLKQGLN